MDSTTLPLKRKRKRSRPAEGLYVGYPDLGISSSEDEEERLRLAELDDFDDISDQDFRPLDEDRRPRKRRTFSEDQSGSSIPDEVASEQTSRDDSVIDQEHGTDDSDERLSSHSSRAVSEDTTSTTSLSFKRVTLRGAFFGYYDSSGSWIPYTRGRTPSRSSSLRRLGTNDSTQIEQAKSKSTLPEVDWKNMNKINRLKYERYFAQAVRQAKNQSHDLEEDIHIGTTIWTADERNVLYRSIARRSRLRPDLISEDVRSKSVLEVIAFIDMMDDQPRRSHRHSYLRHPASTCMSDEWTKFEEAYAEAFINRETATSLVRVTSGETSYSWLDQKQFRALNDAADDDTSKSKRKRNMAKSKAKSAPSGSEKSSDDAEISREDDGDVTSMTSKNGSSTPLDNNLPNGSHSPVDLPVEADLFDMKALSHIFYRLYMKDFDSSIQSDIIPKLYRHVKDFLVRAIFVVSTVAEIRMEATSRTRIWRNKVNVTLEDVLDSLTNGAVCSLLPPRRLQTRADFAMGLPQRIGRAVTEKVNATRHALSLQDIREKGKVPISKRSGTRNFENVPRQVACSLEEWPLWINRKLDDAYEEVFEGDDISDDSSENVSVIASPPLSPTRSERMIDEYDKLHDLVEERELTQRFSGTIENGDLERRWKESANAIRRKLNYDPGHAYNSLGEARSHRGRHFTRHTPSIVVDSDDEDELTSVSHYRGWSVTEDGYTTGSEDMMENTDADVYADDEGMSE